MRKGEIRVLQELQQRSMTVSELAEAVGKSQSWVSELVSSLEEQALVEKNGKVALAGTYESGLFTELLDTYSMEKVLAGKKEEVLTALLDGPKTVSKLEKRGFVASTVYAALDDLQGVGAVKDGEAGYRIVDDTLRRFLEARKASSSGTYTANGERVLKTDRDDIDGVETAFSAFQRYGVGYYPNKRCVYQGDREIELEDVLIHAVLTAENRKQMAMTAVFYLTHRATLDTGELWRLAGKWDCIERWADILAFLDQRDVNNKELFLPWDEFTEIAREYDVYPRGKHPEESLLKGLEAVGNHLDGSLDAYLIGGANLIFRDLKDTTKDIDVVVEDRQAFRALVDALKSEGYEERTDLEEAYEDMAPSIILEKEGFPRWDIFVEVVADALHLTDPMRERSEEGREFGNLHLNLISLTDIFVFKSVTDREGDLEDAALIARQGEVDWNQVLEEVERQDQRTERYFSFAVLDTLDLLVDRYDIGVPIRDRLASYCLENALLFTLKEPKTIEELREELGFPDHQIYNKLQKLEDEGLIEVDRSGKLNSYRAETDPEDRY